MPRPRFTLRALLVAMLVVAAFFGGIHFEQRWERRDSSVQHGVQTVYVRLVDSTTLRRDKTEQFLEAVRSQIEVATPYKVVASTSEADSELLCTISITGDAQQIKVEWIDRRGAKLKPPVSIALDDLSEREITYTANNIAVLVEPAW